MLHDKETAGHQLSLMMPTPKRTPIPRTMTTTSFHPGAVALTLLLASCATPSRKTPVTPEVDAGTQRLFDAGHRFEALARPRAEALVGEDLSPLSGTVDASTMGTIGRKLVLPLGLEDCV